MRLRDLAAGDTPKIDRGRAQGEGRRLSHPRDLSDILPRPPAHLLLGGAMIPTLLIAALVAAYAFASARLTTSL